MSLNRALEATMFTKGNPFMEPALLSYHMANFQTQTTDAELAELAQIIVAGESDAIMTGGGFRIFG